MAGGNLSPRQKMINMMYLVLTALLALNVSKDILKAFQKVEGSLSTAVENIAVQNNLMYSEFQKAADNNPIKVGEWKDLAFNIKDDASELRQYIGDLKDTLILRTGGYDEEGALVGMDNLEKVANEMLKKPQKGALLKAEIQAYKEYMLNIKGVSDNTDLTALIENTFVLDDISKTETWEKDRFDHYPLIAVLTFLTQLQGDVVNIESKVVDYLRSNIGADDMKFSTVAAQVISPKNYVMEGDSFKASISIAAYDDTQTPIIIVTDVFINDTLPDFSKADTIPVALDGRGMYSIPARGIGVQKRAAKIFLTTESGVKEYTEIFEYQVAKPMAVVSPTKMNVFYRGLSNPISVAVPGVSSDKLSVSVSNAQSKKTKDGFDVLPGNGKECKVTVTAEVNGRKQAFPPKLFRVKPVPPPTPEVMGKKGSFNLNKAQLKGVQVVVAKLEDFLFDLKYLVTSFEMSVTVGGMRQDLKSPNNRLTSKMKSILSKMKPGQSVVFKKITAKRFPNGKPELLNGSIIIDII